MDQLAVRDLAQNTAVALWSGLSGTLQTVMFGGTHLPLGIHLQNGDNSAVPPESCEDLKQ